MTKKQNDLGIVTGFGLASFSYLTLVLFKNSDFLQNIQMVLFLIIFVSGFAIANLSYKNSKVSLKPLYIILTIIGILLVAFSATIIYLILAFKDLSY